MNELDKRVKRMEKATHTFVTANDWRWVSDSWKHKLEQAGHTPEEFKDECERLEMDLKNCHAAGDREKFEEMIDSFANRNINGYYAYLYFVSHELSQTRKKGSWIKNHTNKKFLNELLEIRNKRRGQPNQR